MPSIHLCATSVNMSQSIENRISLSNGNSKHIEHDKIRKQNMKQISQLISVTIDVFAKYLVSDKI